MADPVSGPERRRRVWLGRLLAVLGTRRRRQGSGALLLPPHTGVPSPAGPVVLSDGPNVLNLAADPAESMPTPHAEPIVVRKTSKTWMKLPLGMEIRHEDDDTTLADSASSARLDLLRYCKWALFAAIALLTSARFTGVSITMSLIFAGVGGTVIVIVGVIVTVVRKFTGRHKS
jgi:hypothetical protein